MKFWSYLLSVHGSNNSFKKKLQELAADVKMVACELLGSMRLAASVLLLNTNLVNWINYNFNTQ